MRDKIGRYTSALIVSLVSMYCGASRYAFADMQIRFAKRVGENHLKVSFGDGLGANLEAIAFGAYDGPLGPALENHGGARFHLAGRLDINNFRGRRTVQLRLEDAARA